MPERIPPDQVCPECGVSMLDLDPLGHALSHYPEHLDPRLASPLAIRHQKEILAGGVVRSAYRAHEKGA